ncbi:isopentenyl phosphate kinase [Chloroflexota bacterium]
MSNNQYSDLVFLKLGGSLITDKTVPRTPRLDLIARLTAEIKSAKSQSGDFRLVLGHGSGSFGHVTANKYATRQGVDSPDGWRGFADVWYEATTLNRILLDSLHEAGLPGISFPASGAVTARDGKVVEWNLAPIKGALKAGLLPVVFGDVVFDQVRGGTILSTEDIFAHLARQLHPKRILLAGIEEGVWEDFPDCTRLVNEITPENWGAVKAGLSGSRATDVTGGMHSKVRGMLDLVQEIPGMQVIIFKGSQPGNLAAALQGESLGTRITNQ